MWPVGKAATAHTCCQVVPGMLINQRHRETLEIIEQTEK